MKDNFVNRPHSVELEQQLIGAVLADNERFHKVGSLLTADHFFDPVHGRIWRNIAARISRDHIASPVTLKADMEADAGLQRLGGPAYLARMVGGSISGFAVVDYAREIVELANRRAVMQGCEEVVSSLEGGGSTEDAVSALEVMLQGREGHSLAPRSMSLLAAHTKALGHISEAMQSDHYGISTGLKALDEQIGGLRAKELTIIGGATSMGKTTLGTWLAYQAARQGHGVGFASLEMSEEALSNRIASIGSEIPYVAMTRPMSENVFRKLIETVKAQEAMPIQIYSDRVRDIPAILSETKRLRSRWEPNGPFKGLGLLVIDYLQIVRGKGASRFDVLSQVAEDAKAVAKLLSIPVVALAQISRDMSKRESKVPHLGDIRGSGDVENAADNVIFTHRPAYYLERMEPPDDVSERADYEAALSDSKNTMDLIVAKQRMGPLGRVRVGCDMATNRFWNLDNQEGMEF